MGKPALTPLSNDGGVNVVLFFMVALHLRRNRREAAAAAAKERRAELSQDDQDLLDEVLEI